mmetsp:Transcript_88053/g.233779  ORF Transcript_88053/g.233779 Transcript_88053/m.233779 type:complete len:258 (+) Transcript_88053:1520-2293(+)
MRSKLCSKASAYFTKGWSRLVRSASSRPLAPAICSRASTPMFTRGIKEFSSDKCTSARLTTNHSRAFHSTSFPSSSEKSKQLFMPTTGCTYSPMESSFRCTSAWNMASPRLVPASQAGSNRFTCQRDCARSKLASFGSKENMGSRPSQMRTCKANAKYSIFSAAAGFTVGATRAMLLSSSNVSVYMPLGAMAKPIFFAQARFRGTCWRFQPIPFSSRLLRFRSASRRWRVFSSRLAHSNISWAWHSACKRRHDSSLR